MADDDYESIVKGPLRLKSDSGVKKKKKKKNKKKDDNHNKKLLQHVKSETNREEKPEQSEMQMTKAEISFQKMQEKTQKERILQKATMTHKQRVEEFNRHLDSLTEHFDIPKVSWTK